MKKPNEIQMIGRLFLVALQGNSRLFYCGNGVVRRNFEKRNG
ncbi:hypothetical protein JOD24_001687 [Kroppenstedtia sanguinis]|uniref:Uncharacterized protein n=1 Tax=Kroppenstedtia sanguinis TaxID=1380684 RepID=A0ABW4C9A3_9BACL